MTTRRIVSAVLAVALSGCMMGRDYSRPAVDVPDRFRYALPAGGARAQPPAAALEWWQQFNDPVLTDLISSALQYNYDLRIAAARLLEFQALVASARSPLFPQLTATGSKTRAGQGPLGITETYQGGLGLSWELDFWGRIRRLSEAAYADFVGQEYAQRAVALSLIGAVSSSYIQLRELDERLDLARRTRDSRNEAQRLAALRYKSGTISELELKQAAGEYLVSVSTVEQLEQAVAQKENELNVLLGRNPGEIVRGKRIDTLVVPVVPAGLPSALLTRRPDILRAEQGLVAANARVGAAKANFFPTISLTGAYGGASIQLASLFTAANRQWSFSPGFSAPVFTGGALTAQLAASEQQREQALLGYRQTVQSAFREVEDALVAITKTREQIATQTRLVEELRRYSYLAHRRYMNGLTSNLEVLDAERNLFSAEQSLVQAQSAALVATVDLYKALGGDWSTHGLEQAQQKGAGS